MHSTHHLTMLFIGDQVKGDGFSVFHRTAHTRNARPIACVARYQYIRDVTDCKRAELKLHKAKETAEAANRAKSTFLSSMSHELRTPLNAILGFAELLSRDSEAPPKQQKYIDTMNRNRQHLLELIDDVLEVSETESGEVKLHHNKFNLCQLLNHLYGVFQI